MPVPDARTDSEIARDFATSAGQLLLKLRADRGFSDPWKLRDAGDHDSNVHLLELFAEHRPDDIVLSEESADDSRRLAADRVWIIDPLDGTREYGMPGRPDWAVHVALWERSANGITAAAVAQPALNAVYASDDGAATASESMVFLVSDSRPPAFAAPVAEKLGGDLQPMGSAGAKAMAVLRGDADAYLHAGGQWEWDSAAPVGVVLAAGDGQPVSIARDKDPATLATIALREKAIAVRSSFLVCGTTASQENQRCPSVLQVRGKVEPFTLLQLAHNVRPVACELSTRRAGPIVEGIREGQVRRFLARRNGVVNFIARSRFSSVCVSSHRVCERMHSDAACSPRSLARPR